MADEIRIDLLDFVLAMASATDLVSPLISNHHKRVAYITDSIAVEMGLSTDRRASALVAAAVHDLGAFSMQERADTLEFEMDNPHQHAEVGYVLFRDLTAFPKISEIIRYHHLDWQDGRGAYLDGARVPDECHILHLADRVDVLIRPGGNPLAMADDIVERIEANSGRLFVPEQVNAFKRAAAREYFWFDVVSPNLNQILRNRISLPELRLDAAGLLSNAKTLSHVIDFKSVFTSTHTAGVAACVQKLSKLCGIPQSQLLFIAVSGFLHDLGKLAIPAEILEKRSKLTSEEFNLVKSHPYHTMRILDSVENFQNVRDWAALHHEHLDGSGYPFHLSEDELPLGSRIVAVADYFVALTEDRPYRIGMSMEQVRQSFKDVLETRKLDPFVAGALLDEYREIDGARIKAQDEAAQDYKAVIGALV